jgi:glycosyltransferase involved in cell wall biosynthesis
MSEPEQQTRQAESPKVGLVFQAGEQARVKNETLPEMLKREKIAIVIPAYNEERFIGSVVLKARRYAKSVIVVDDGSTDSTAEIAAQAGAQVVRHPKNLGKGAALNSGFKIVREAAPQVVVMLDGDGQHHPEEVEKVIEPILSDKADIVIGSRYLENTSDVPRQRIMGHWAFNWLTRLSSGTKSTDSQSGFRAFSPAALGKIDFFSPGFSVESEMQFIAKQNKLRLVEVPITIHYTDKPKRPVFLHGMGVLNGILRLMGQYRPLLFFGVPGAILLTSGILLGIYVVNIYSRFKTLAAGYAMISVLLSIIGMLLLSTGITLHSIRALLIDFQNHNRND